MKSDVRDISLEALLEKECSQARSIVFQEKEAYKLAQESTIFSFLLGLIGKELAAFRTQEVELNKQILAIKAQLESNPDVRFCCYTEILTRLRMRALQNR